MSASELFPSSEVECPSPRLLWLRLHNLALGELPSGLRFCAASDRITTADTHKDCELKMAEELEVEHWSIVTPAEPALRWWIRL